MALEQVGGISALLSVDIKDLRKAFRQAKQEARNSLREINREFQKFENDVKQSVQSIKDSIDSFNGSINSSAQHLRTQTRQMMNDMRSVSMSTRRNLQTMGNHWNQYTQNIQTQATQFQQSMQDIRTSIRSAQQSTVRNFSTMRRHFDQLANSAQQSAHQIQQSMRNIQHSSQNASQANANAGGSGGGGSKLAEVAGGVGATVGTSMLIGIGVHKDSVLTRLQNQTGATEEEMKALSKSIENVYKTGYGDFGEIAEAMSVVKRETGLTGQELEEATKRALILSKTYDYDVKESIRAANSLMIHFGVSNEKAMDIMTKTAQVAGDAYDDLLDTFNEYAPQVKEMGLNAEQFANYLVIGAKSGVYNLDKVADVLKELNLRIVGGGKPVEQALEQIGLKYDKILAKIKKGGPEAKEAYDQIITGINNIKDEATKKALVFTLAGAPGEDVGNNFFKGIAENKDKNLLGNIDGTVDKQMKTFEESAQAQFEKMKANFITIFAPLGIEMMKVITDIMVALEPLIQLLTGLFKNPVFSKVVGIFILLATAILGIIGPLGLLIQGVMTFATALGPVAGAIGTFLTGPIGILIASIVALGAALWYMYENNILGFRDGIKELGQWFVDLYNKIADFFTGLTSAFKNNGLTGVLTYIKDAFMNNFGWIISWFQNNFPLISEIIGLVVDFIKNHFNDISEPILSAWNHIKEFFSTLIQLPISFMSIWEQYGPEKAFEYLGERLAYLASLVWDVMADITTAIINYFALIPQFFIENWEAIKQIWDKALDSLKETWNTFKDWFVNGWNSAWNTATNKLTEFVNWIPTALSNLPNLFATIFNSALSFVKGFADGVFKHFFGIPGGISEALGKAKQFINDWTGGLFESGAKMLNTLVNGIRSVIEKPKQAVMEALQKVRNLLPFSDAKEGPLDSLTHNGSKIMSTIAEGVNQGRSVLYNTMTNALNGASEIINGTQGTIGIGVGMQQFNTNNSQSKVIRIDKVIVEGVVNPEQIIEVLEEYVDDHIKTHQK